MAYLYFMLLVVITTCKTVYKIWPELSLKEICNHFKIPFLTKYTKRDGVP